MNHYVRSLNKSVLDSDIIRSQMPNIGDELLRTPTLYSNAGAKVDLGPMKCKVTYVNYKNLWYEVQFESEDYPFKESFKLPRVKKRVRSGLVCGN